MEDDDFFREFNDEPTVMGYGEMKERWRAGAEIMATEIEGTGTLARAQQKLELKQAGSSTERALLAFYNEVKRSYYKRFAPDDEVLMFDRFRGLKNYTFKNPYAFLLAYIAEREGALDKRQLAELMDIVKGTGTSNVEEADIIRYYRLLNQLS
jgi:hypothetical protein